MKALTIYQPYASLIAVGAKRFETRSRRTNYRGRIAIHAGLKDCAGLLSSEQITAAVRAFADTRYAIRHSRGKGGYDYIYPFGAIIATAELVECWSIVNHPGADVDEARHISIGAELDVPKGHPDFSRIIVPSENELLFGDWRPGRFAWELTNVELLDEPIPCRGQQGLWNAEFEVARK